MLQEILLSLSGVPSQIWDQTKEDQWLNKDGVNDYIAPPERAMLQVLARLSRHHLEIIDGISTISINHPSSICRTVASSISANQISKFRRKVLDVESSILRKDATFVGGYSIVPLSTIVSEFTPWTRRLEWLCDVVGRLSLQSSSSAKASHWSGPDLLNFLYKETFTGYSDVEDMANELLVDGQRAWLRLAASWILYAKLSAMGTHDFFVHQHSKNPLVKDSFEVDYALVPYFVNKNAVELIFSIGHILNQLGSQKNRPSAEDTKSNNLVMELLHAHLNLLESLTYPLNSSMLEQVLFQINQSISENALSQILPTQQIAALLRVVWDFLLLGRGEFAMSLISVTDERISLRNQDQTSVQPVRKSGRLDDLKIKETELNTILSKTWVELESLQTVEDLEDEEFIIARKLIRLTEPDKDHQVLINTLLPTPAILRMTFPDESPLQIFMGQSESRIYATVNAYLLSLRRAGVHLANLWKLTGFRRSYPTPIGPPFSATEQGKRALETYRKRETQRTKFMRQHWACCSKVIFVLNELESYFHREVLGNSWDHFHDWLGGKSNQRPSSAKSHTSRPSTASSVSRLANNSHFAPTNKAEIQSPAKEDVKPPSDPRTLAVAHRQYLDALCIGLLLKNEDYIEVLKGMLGIVDHYVALFVRLQSVWQGLDLQEDDGVMDAFSNYAKDEKEILAEMKRTRLTLEDLLTKLVEKIKTAEQQHSDVGDVAQNFSQIYLNREKFQPWRARTIDRLIMKLSFISGTKDDEEKFSKSGWKHDEDDD